MITTDTIQGLLREGGDVVDHSGEKVGGIGQVYLDDNTGQPEWVTVKTGLFGTSESLVPLAQATSEGNELRVPYPKDTIKDAPRIEADKHISPEEEEQLYRYYGLESTGTDQPAVGAGDVDQGTRGGVQEGSATSGTDTDDAMTRSEEQLHVGKERQATGKARLRKYVVTENVTKTVPVTREEVRVEREPITEENRDEALSGPELTEDEHEVTLSEERAVVDKETVPVERVRLDTETVTDEQQVSEEVRKEQVEADLPEEGTEDDRP